MASRLFQNCPLKNCVVCISRINSILLRIDSIVLRIDSIIIKIDSICTTFDSIVSTIDSVKKTDSMQNYRLDHVPRSTQYLLILP